MCYDVFGKVCPEVSAVVARLEAGCLTLEQAVLERVLEGWRAVVACAAVRLGVLVLLTR